MAICKICMSWMINHRELPGWKRCSHCRYSEKMETGMVTLKELNSRNFKTSAEIDKNLQELLEKINKVRKLWNKPMIVTSGLRSIEDHKRIYKEKGVEESKIPMGSKHLFGQAVDISDPKGELGKWCIANEDKLKEIGLWCEDIASCPGWVHFQSVQYGSWKPDKSRFFKP
jgi:LAS superfamily LD-carboxypeptidase LdcB